MLATSPSRREVLRLVSLATVTSMVPLGLSDEATAAVPVQTGAERTAKDGFSQFRGKRVGLITNHTGRIATGRLIDALANATGVTLTAVLTPEHGLSGTTEAGAKVKGSREGRTGIPVHSLYGATLKPTPRMLEGLDVLVFDMQDIGTRFYTYISTMGLAMQAAAEARLRFVVLDRPNPLGGRNVEGFVLEPRFASFVGRFAIPVRHGLTVGELARTIKRRRLFPGLERLDLEVIAMTGWRRDMLWPETGLPWVATSPNIPTFETALAYAGTGLFEATTASEGRGTEAPFLTLGHAAIPPTDVIERLEKVALSGLSLRSIRVTPKVISGVATNPRFKDRNIGALRLEITDPKRFPAVETGVHLLAAFSEALRGRGDALIADASFFDKLAGTDRLSNALGRGTPPRELVANWADEVARFKEACADDLIYS